VVMQCKSFLRGENDELIRERSSSHGAPVTSRNRRVRHPSFLWTARHRIASDDSIFEYRRALNTGIPQLPLSGELLFSSKAMQCNSLACVVP
jgi:hypothetical protein